MYGEGVLQVRLLGGAAAECHGEQLSLPPPAARLLAFLAVRPGLNDREAAAALLWPGSAGTAARANLLTAVWALRKAVGNEALMASRTAVGLRPEAVTVDLTDCRRCAAAGDMTAAAALCRRELLAGYAEDWAEAARRELRAELAAVECWPWNGSWNGWPRSSSAISVSGAIRRAICAGHAMGAEERASRNASPVFLLP